MNQFLLTIPTALLCCMIFLNISKQKFSLTEILVKMAAACVFAIASSAAFAHLPASALNSGIAVNLALALCLIIFAYRKTKNLLLSGMYALFSVAIAMIANHLTAVHLLHIIGEPIEYIRGNLLLFAALVLPAFLICFVPSRFIGHRLSRSYGQLLSPEMRKKFAAFGLTLAAMAYVLSQANIFIYWIGQDVTMLSAINVMALITIFLLAVVMMSAYTQSQQKLTESEYKNKSLQDLENYVQQLEKAYDEMRGYRHDQHNLLHSLLGHARSGNTIGLESQLAQTLAYSEESLQKLDISMGRLKYIHIPELRGLLSAKFAYALACGIELEIDIADPVENISMDLMDLCRIVGIMADNAIEELLLKEHLSKLLRFGILIDGTDVLIVCSNACAAPPDAQKIFAKDYSTKGTGRGLGLYNLKNICEKSGNAMFMANVDDNEFALIVTISEV